MKKLFLAAFIFMGCSIMPISAYASAVPEENGPEIPNEKPQFRVYYWTVEEGLLVNIVDETSGYVILAYIVDNEGYVTWLYRIDNLPEILNGTPLPDLPGNPNGF